MPMHSRAGEWTSILREFGDDEDGDHPGAFADHVEDLLGDAFELEARLREVPAEPGASSWDEALEQSGQLRTLAAKLDDPDQLAELRTRVETLLAYWRTVLRAMWSWSVGGRPDEVCAPKSPTTTRGGPFAIARTPARLPLDVAFRRRTDDVHRVSSVIVNHPHHCALLLLPDRRTSPLGSASKPARVVEKLDRLGSKTFA